MKIFCDKKIALYLIKDKELMYSTRYNYIQHFQRCHTRLQLWFYYNQ